MRWVQVLLLLAGVAAAQADDFGKGLRSVENLLERGLWKRSRKALDTLLSEHRDRNYARARLAHLQRLMKQCVFRARHGTPDPRKLVSGKLVSYQPATGRIKIEYRSDQMGDFETRGSFRMHRAAFSGPHTITLKGRSYPGSGTGPQIIVCDNNEEHILAIPGMPERTVGNSIRWMPVQILYFKGKEERTVARREKSPCAIGRKFRLTVVVNKGSVAIGYNNKSLAKGRKRLGLWGFAGFSRTAAFDEVVLEGFAGKSWIQGLIDREDQKRLRSFERGYDPMRHLPVWLFEEAVPEANLARPDGRVWPGTELDAAARRFLDDAQRRLDGGRWKDGLAVVERSAGEVPRVLADFLRALLYAELGRHEEALAALRRVCAEDTRFVRGQLLMAEMLEALGKGDQAIAIHGALREEYPGGDGLCVTSAQLLHRLGRSREARTLLEAAIGRGVTSPALRRWHERLVKATDGPPWTRSYEFKSKHYHVITSIDRKTCYEAARILEAAYTIYVARLERVEDAERRRFRVYLFPGEPGYTRYCKDLFGYSLSQSAGCYDPHLKQLMIWNAPKRDEMMRTVRHEGFHQYLDRIMDSPPLWFNEGLAEYYESATLSKGVWKLDGVRHDHVRALETKGMIPLATFLHLGHEPFMADAGRTYAQSWAFICFLRHGSEGGPRLFDRFWEQFKRGGSNRAAIRNALEGTRMRQLQAAFSGYVARLK